MFLQLSSLRQVACHLLFVESVVKIMLIRGINYILENYVLILVLEFLFHFTCCGIFKEIFALRCLLKYLRHMIWK
jgi:hypothetical protein